MAQLSRPVMSGGDQLDLGLAVLCGNVEDITRILEEGVPVNSRASDGWIALHKACFNNRADIAKLLLKYKADVNQQDSEGDTPLHKAFYMGAMECITLLRATGMCDLGILNKSGRTPLGEAIYHGNPKIFKFLIKKLDMDAHKGPVNEQGDTPLGFASRGGKLEIVKFLVSVVNVDVNAPATKSGQTPLALTHQNEIIRVLLQYGAHSKDAYSKIVGKFLDPLTNPVKLFIIGRGGEGKSTLVKSMEQEPSFLQNLTERWFTSRSPQQVTDVNQQTAGIVTKLFKSQVFGDVEVFDFAGQDTYYSSHAAIVKSVVNTCPPIFLLVLGLHRDDDAIIRSISYWLGLISNQCDNMQCKAPLIVVGSYVDQVAQTTSIDRKKRLITQSISNNSTFDLVKTIAMDCRYPQSEGLTLLRRSLETSCSVIRSKLTVTLNSHMLLIFLLDKYAKEIAVQLEEVQQKINADADCSLSRRDREILSFIPNTIPHLVEICVQLNDKSHILFLHNNTSPEKSFIVLNKTALLSKVNGTIFAPENFKQHCELSTSTGVVPNSKLSTYIPDVEVEVLTGFLFNLELAVPIEDGEVLELLNKEHFPQDRNNKHIFCPALIRLDPPRGIWENMKHSFGWMLSCVDRNQFFDARFQQILILRLAFSQVIAPEIKSHVPTLQHQCSVWKTGICWSISQGAKVVVEVIDHNKTIVLLQTREQSLECLTLRSVVIKKVLKAVSDVCPSVSTAEQILAPASVNYPIELSIAKLFSIKTVAQSIVNRELGVVSNNGQCTVQLNQLFDVYVHLGENVLRSLFNENDAIYNSTISDRYISAVSSFWSKNSQISKIIYSALTTTECVTTPQLGVESLRKVLTSWRERSEGTYSSLRHILDPLSIFAGKNPMEIADIPPKEFEEDLLPVLPVPQAISTDGGVVTIDNLMRKTGVTDNQLNALLKENDLHNIAACFNDVDTYIYNLGLLPGQQTDIQDLARRSGTQIAMAKALKLWGQPNPIAATYRALLVIVLDLRRGDVALRVCKCLSENTLSKTLL